MPQLVYKGRRLQAEPGESVLDCLRRSDIPIASSCRSGVCQSCLVQGKSEPPPKSQKGLSKSLVKQNFLLSCQCAVEDSPELVEEVELPVFSSRVLRIERRADTIYRVFIARPRAFEYAGGQFVQISAQALPVTRSYSIASAPHQDELELHIERLRGGRMSTYLTTEEGAPLRLRGPAGECSYNGDPDEQLVLVGTGTGLAPLVGVVRSALSAGHAGPIHLYHGASQLERLYLDDELSQLAAQHENLSYVTDVRLAAGADASSQERGLPTLLKKEHPDMKGLRVYLCGNPDLVAQLKKQCFLSGASLSMIHSDPFIVAPREEQPEEE